MPAKDIGMETEGQEYLIKYTPDKKRAKYPFKEMNVGDYVLVHQESEALAVRSALKSFYRRIKNRRFTVRMKIEDDNVWVCRRVA